MIMKNHHLLLQSQWEIRNYNGYSTHLGIQNSQCRDFTSVLAIDLE